VVKGLGVATDAARGGRLAVAELVRSGEHAAALRRDDAFRALLDQRGQQASGLLGERELAGDVPDAGVDPLTLELLAVVENAVQPADSTWCRAIRLAE
jgi:hypothetical protein